MSLSHLAQVFWRGVKTPEAIEIFVGGAGIADEFTVGSKWSVQTVFSKGGKEMFRTSPFETTLETITQRGLRDV